MRDKLKTKEYFDNYIAQDAGRPQKLIEWIKIGKVVENRVPSSQSIHLVKTLLN